MRWRQLAGSTLLLTAAFGAVGAITISAPAGAAQTVPIMKFSFQPSTITVPVGATVTWTNNDAQPHSVTADNGSFDSSPGCSPNTTQPCLAQGATYAHRFGAAGTFTYHCSVHSFMHGTVVVTAAPTGTIPVPATSSGRATLASNLAALGLLALALACAGGVFYMVERQRPAAPH